MTCSICNAGIVSSKREVTADGHELMFQVRDLNLTQRVLPSLFVSC